MTGFTRHDVPADIAVFAGQFDSQPMVFAHLLTACPALDLGHVDVIQEANPTARLAAYFDNATVSGVVERAGAANTIALILPAAYDELDCPFRGSPDLQSLGVLRGTVPRLVAQGGPS